MTHHQKKKTAVLTLGVTVLSAAVSLINSGEIVHGALMAFVGLLCVLAYECLNGDEIPDVATEVVTPEVVESVTGEIAARLERDEEFGEGGNVPVESAETGDDVEPAPEASE